MKTKRFKITILSLLVVFLFGFFPNFSFNTARAAIVEDSFADTALIGALKDLYLEVKGVELITLTNDCFEDEAFVDINLSREGKANKISNLGGLERLDFPYAKSLNLSGNLIKEFTKDHLVGFNQNVLSSIDLSENNIEKFDIVTDTTNNIRDYTKITNLDLSGNKIEKADISEIINGGDSSTKAVVDLSGNNISTADNIIVSQSAELNLDLNIVGNNIQDIDKLVSTKINMFVGSQGFKGAEDLTTSTKFSYTKLNLPNFRLVFYDKLHEVALENLMINESVLESNMLEFQLGIGRYKLWYIYDENGDNIMDETLPDDLTLFERNILNIEQEFIVSPSTPTYLFVVKGKEKEELGHLKGVGKIKVSTIDECTIKYKYSYEDEWREGNEIDLNRGGKYGVEIKAVSDVFESDVVYIDIHSSNNPKIPDMVLILILVGLFLLMMFVILPLLGKYFVKR